MQKNKFVHEDIKAVCNTATKKLVALGLCVAVGGTGFPGPHNLIADAQQNVPVGEAPKNFKKLIKKVIFDIDKAVNSVEQLFTLETIKRVLRLPKETRLSQVFSAWSNLVPHMQLDQVLTENTEACINRLLTLMPQQEREQTERILARLNQRNSDEALFFVLRDIALIVERPLNQFLDRVDGINDLRSVVIAELATEEAVMQADARREEEESARCKDVARGAAEETVTRAREKLKKKRMPRLFLGPSVADGLPSAPAALREYADGQDKVRGGNGPNVADGLPSAPAALREYADGQDKVRGGNRFNRALQALLEIEQAEQRARLKDNWTAEQRARLKDNWMKAEESFQRALFEDDLMEAAESIKSFWNAERQRLYNEKNRTKEYDAAGPEVKRVVDLIRKIQQTAEQIERNFGSRSRIQVAVQRRLLEPIRHAFSVFLSLPKLSLDDISERILYGCEKIESRIDSLLWDLPRQERHMIIQRIDGMSREDIGTLIVVLEGLAELVALPNSLSPAAFNSEFDAHVHRWQETYADEDARRSKAEEIYARFNHAMNRIKSACSTSTNPERCVENYVYMSYCQPFSCRRSQDVFLVLQDQALLDFATSALHLEDAERFVIHLEGSAIIAEEDAARREERARRKAEEQARREAEKRVRREAEERARREAEEQARREAEEEARRMPVVYRRPYSNGNIDGIIVTRANDVEIQCDASVAAEGANRINAGESSTVYSTSSNLFTHDGTGAGIIDGGDIEFSGFTEERLTRDVTVNEANSVTVAPGISMCTQNGDEFSLGRTRDDTIDLAIEEDNFNRASERVANGLEQIFNSNTAQNATESVVPQESNRQERNLNFNNPRLQNMIEWAMNRFGLSGQDLIDFVQRYFIQGG